MIVFHQHHLKVPTAVPVVAHNSPRDPAHGNAGPFGHLRAAVVGDAVYFAPTTQKKIVKFDFKTETVKRITTPTLQNLAADKQLCTSAVSGDPSTVYFPPYGADYYLSLKTATDQVSRFGHVGSAIVRAQKPCVLSTKYVIVACGSKYNDYIGIHPTNNTISTRRGSSYPYFYGAGTAPDGTHAISVERFNRRYYRLFESPHKYEYYGTAYGIDNQYAVQHFLEQDGLIYSHSGTSGKLSALNYATKTRQVINTPFKMPGRGPQKLRDNLFVSSETRLFYVYYPKENKCIIYNSAAKAAVEKISLVSCVSPDGIYYSADNTYIWKIVNQEFLLGADYVN